MSQTVIKIGTSGYSYDDWSGVFYPEALNSKGYLRHYSKNFNVVEINSTYYRIPKPQMFAAMLKKVPDDFRFVVKLSKQFTHKRGEAGEALKPYKKGISPLLHHDKLITLLAQFPYSFKPGSDSLEHLKFIRKSFEGIPVNVEFRNEYWIRDKTFEFLEENDLGYVSVDMPRLPRLVPPVAKSTSPLGYVRFHGRVEENWWDPPEPHMRYDYLYETKELKEWVPKVEKLAEKTDRILLFFNNHFEAKSAKNAKQMSQLLELSPPEVAREPDDIEFPDNQGRLF